MGGPHGASKNTRGPLCGHSPQKAALKVFLSCTALSPLIFQLERWEGAIKPTSGESQSRLPLSEVEKRKCSGQKPQARHVRYKEQRRVTLVSVCLGSSKRQRRRNRPKWESVWYWPRGPEPWWAIAQQTLRPRGKDSVSPVCSPLHFSGLAYFWPQR